MNKIALAFLALSVLASCDKKSEERWSQNGNLSLSTEKPMRGESVRLKYKKAATGTAKVDLQSILYVIVDDEVYAQDLNVENGDTTFIETIKIPDSATAIAFLFKADKKMDTNNDSGYVYELYDKDGNEIPGSTLSALHFKSGMGSYLAEIKFQPEEAAEQLKSSFKNNSANKEKLIPEYFGFIKRADDTLAKNLAAEYSERYKNKTNLSEEDYDQLTSLYRILGNEDASDSIQQLATKDYAMGTIANEKSYRELLELTTVEEKEGKFAEIDTSFEKSSWIRPHALQQLAVGYMEKGNTEKFLQYASKIEDKDQLASLYNYQAWEMAGQDKQLDFALKISKRSLDLMEELLENPENKPNYLTESQFKDQLEGSEKMYIDTYAFILFKEGKIKDALSYQEKAIGNGKNPETNEHYIQYLIADHQYDKAQSNAEVFIKENAATTKIKEFLKEAYTNGGKKQEDFEGYLIALEETAKKKAKSDLKESMIDDEAPQFSLINLDGEQVTLADLKGKTVVLDFWATWCGPCKSSFPGMQMAVDKFKDDPNVAFLFVDTWESSTGEERMESVSEFIKQNKYSFNVLMDVPLEEGSREYKVVSEYGVDGIPTKFVLGPDGRVKFKAVGYSGSTDALASEIELMIELTQS
ncbi:TlpA disulfide reductase family protein [Flavimarina sp. Hel_I_48]|uniref:TlpA disulfide reductase family protein n=1 Tax=Flavimarina sp. Hel_I_48 TaxID=1392488 RepID=UPI00069187EB|nr:TlpA disulfide reductase family protein [Flavimarina sp. Hel_I_48]